MRPAPFRYHAPRSQEETLSLLAQHGEEARLLAGGQSLVPLMNLRMLRPAVLIDLNKVAGLSCIETRDGAIVFGPMVRQHDAERSDIVGRDCPLVARALALAGPIAVRSRATVGGTLAHADRSAELPGVAVALDASFVIRGSQGTRTVPASEFFVDDLTTATGPDEMLCEISIPFWPEHDFAVFLEAGTRQRDLAVAGVAAALRFANRRCVEARLCLTGIARKPVRLADAEHVIIAEGPGSPLVAEAVRQILREVDMASDLHASIEHRRHVSVALVEKAMSAAARHASRHGH